MVSHSDNVRIAQSGSDVSEETAEVEDLALSFEIFPTR